MQIYVKEGMVRRGDASRNHGHGFVDETEKGARQAKKVTNTKG